MAAFAPSSTLFPTNGIHDAPARGRSTATSRPRVAIRAAPRAVVVFSPSGTPAMLTLEDLPEKHAPFRGMVADEVIGFMNTEYVHTPLPAVSSSLPNIVVHVRSPLPLEDTAMQFSTGRVARAADYFFRLLLLTWITSNTHLARDSLSLSLSLALSLSRCVLSTCVHDLE
jgi:hypothetical protein